MKIFGIGCPRTGTSTLSAALTRLGYRVGSWDAELFRAAMAGDPAPALRVADKYDAFQDLPWCMLYRELDTAFPGSKFILTVRKSSDIWLKSWKKHHLSMFNALLNDDGSEIIGGSSGFPLYPRGISGYEAHNKEVEEYFRHRPHDLLQVSWEAGNGWEELCRFVDCPRPNEPFPFENRSKTSRVAMRLLKKRFETYFRD